MIHGGTFSGIGAWELASKKVGWQNLFAVETNPFCRAVLNKNFNRWKFTKTLKLRISSLTKEKSTFFRARFRVKKYQSQGAGKGYMPMDFSSNTYVPLMKADPDTLFGKMSEMSEYISLKSRPSFPESGIAYNGLLYVLRGSGTLTKENVYSELHITPTFSDGMRYKMSLETLKKRYTKHPNGNLAEQLAGRWNLKITPSFCGMTMGFPKNWARLKSMPTEMRSYLKSLK